MLAVRRRIKLRCGQVDRCPVLGDKAVMPGTWIVPVHCPYGFSPYAAAAASSIRTNSGESEQHLRACGGTNGDQHGMTITHMQKLSLPVPTLDAEGAHVAGKSIVRAAKDLLRGVPAAGQAKASKRKTQLH